MKRTAPPRRHTQDDEQIDPLPGLPLPALFSLFVESLCDDTTPMLHDAAANGISSLALAADREHFNTPAKLRSCLTSIKAVVSRVAADEAKAAAARAAPLPADVLGEHMCVAAKCLFNLAGADDCAAALVAALLASTPGGMAVVDSYDAVLRASPPGSTHAFMPYLLRGGGSAQPERAPLDDATLKEWACRAHSVAQRAERSDGGAASDDALRDADAASRRLLVAAAGVRPFAPRASRSPVPSPYERSALVRAAVMLRWAALRARAARIACCSPSRFRRVASR